MPDIVIDNKINGSLLLGSSHIELEEGDVSILHDVFLALLTVLTLILDLGL